MSDFIGNLISRHLDPGASVKPDLLGRFETRTSHDPVHTDTDVFDQTDRTNDFLDQNKNAARPIENEQTTVRFFEKKERSDDFSRQEASQILKPENENILPGKLVTRNVIPAPKDSYLSDLQKDNSYTTTTKTADGFSNKKPQANDQQAGILSKSANVPGLAKPTEFYKNQDNTPAAPAIPIIKVTIGRLDVCAMMPSAPAPAPPKPGPKPLLSLEDYIKQRSI